MERIIILILFSFYFQFVFCINQFEHEFNYEKNTSFPIDKEFTSSPLEELRVLFHFKAAWTTAPDGLFENVPVIYNEFLKNLSKGTLAQVLNKMNKAILDVNKQKEARVVLIRYAYCLHKKDMYRNCPRPCNNNPCARYQLKNNVCRNKYSQDVKLNTNIKNMFPMLASIFQYKAECTCGPGYKWDENKVTGAGNCVPFTKKCENIKICVHGTCYPFDNEDGYVCKCNAAFQGLQCDILYNPCLNPAEHQCGEFNCERNPNNFIHGYQCKCGTQFIARSKDDPTCIDRDECLNSPCKNNGTCINTYGNYTCVCKEGFTGQDCYLDISANLKLNDWNDWSLWSGCSRTCKTLTEPGFQRRNRSCPVVNTCGDDTDRQIRECYGLSTKCGTEDGIVLNNVPYLMYNSSNTLTKKTIFFTNFPKNAALSLQKKYSKLFVVENGQVVKNHSKIVFFKFTNFTFFYVFGLLSYLIKK